MTELKVGDRVRVRSTEDKRYGAYDGVPGVVTTPNCYDDGVACEVTLDGTWEYRVFHSDVLELIADEPPTPFAEVTFHGTARLNENGWLMLPDGREITTPWLNLLQKAGVVSFRARNPYDELVAAAGQEIADAVRPLGDRVMAEIVARLDNKETAP